MVLDYLDVIVIIGESLLLTGFILNVTNKLKSNNKVYYLLNITGASLYLYSYKEYLSRSNRLSLELLIYIVLGSIWAFTAIGMFIKNILQEKNHKYEKSLYLRDQSFRYEFYQIIRLLGILP